MSAVSRTHSQTQRLLSAATSALPHPHRPAETCTNLPEPASINKKSQIEPTHTAPGFLPESIRATYPKTDEKVRQFIASLRSSPTPPAQTCRNLHKPASQPEKSQIKAKSHPDTPPVPHSSFIIQPSSFPPLSPRQLLAARLLLQGHTAKAVAAHLCVNPHTISDWKKRPAFQQEIATLLNHQSRSRR